MSGCTLKQYLGDGVYAEWRMQEGTLVLTTENGVSITNTIYLEPDVLDALARFIDKVVPNEH